MGGEAMNIGICHDKESKGEFYYSPLFEMMASLHVLTKPEHHLERLKWMEKVHEEVPEELLAEIRSLSQLTNEWLIVMDFAHANPYVELSIPDALNELEELGLPRWNKVFSPYDKSVDKEERNRIIRVMRSYYEVIFQYEIAFLQPFLIRTLKRELEDCKREGLLLRLNKYHERLKVDGSELVFYKNKEYRYEINNINKIMITASTFISPHLLMHEERNTVYVTMLVAVEERKNIVPPELILLMKALGDETRLKILHEIRKKPSSTQSLARKLNLTEAGISKHLKMLHEAGLVNKERRGNYILYEINKVAIDFIPYTLYEYIM
jgi:DNA-binding transcriptional ArsR family regulator